MTKMYSRVARNAARRAPWRWVLASVCVALVSFAPMQVTYTLDSTFPSLSPMRLAHYLSDFTNHPRLYPYLNSWMIEQQSNNHTSWHYSVSYNCGARCAGRAEVTAHDEIEHPPARGSTPKQHVVLITHSYCISIPLLPWPKFCDEVKTEATIRRNSADSAFYSEISSKSCTALRVLTGRCLAELRFMRSDYLQRLKMLLEQYQ